MTIEEIKKSRNFEIQKRTNSYLLNYKHSNLSKARDVHEFFKSLNGYMAWDDVNGGKAVGGYYASVIISEKKAKELGIIDIERG